MIKIADIFELKNGKKKVEFFHLGIYDLLREKLGFRYTRINKKGYYLKYSNGIYKVASFHELKDSFLDFIKNDFDSIEFNISVDYHDFINEYYKQSPVKNGDFARDYLSENFALSDENKHLVLLEVDFKYSNDFAKNEMIKFLNIQGFIETIDKVGSFCKDCPLYYKKKNSNEFLVINIPFCKSKASQTNFDLWKISAKSEKEFLLKKYANPKAIMLGFDLKRDFDLFDNEMKNKNGC